MTRQPPYEEVLQSWLFFAVFGIMSLLALFFLGMFFYQVAVGPFGSNPALNGYFILMFLVMAGTALIVFQMRRLEIRIDDRGVRVRFGAFRQEYAWEEIVSVEPDCSSWLRYGGWGIRFARAEGHWRRGYTVIGAPRVVLTLRTGRFRQFAFSTNRPEAVIQAIGKRIQL